MKKIAVWGTGQKCRELLDNGKALNIDIFIDNDISKKDTCFEGKQVFYPSSITGWKEIYVIVAVGAYREIKKQLIDIGLEEYRDFCFYEDWIDYSYPWNQIKKDTEDKINDLIEKRYIYEGGTWIFGDFVSYDKGICSYINKLAEQFPSEKYCLFSEAVWIKEKIAKKKVNIPYIVLPIAFAKNKFPKADASFCVNDSIVNEVKKKEYLRMASLSMRQQHREMQVGYEYESAYWANYYAETVIEYLKPRRVLLWNEFHAIHRIIAHVCKTKKIEVKYMEFGVLPGTFVMEDKGQMGESFPARHPMEFMRMPVMDSEIIQAEEVWRYLRKSGLNRNHQIKNNILEDIQKHLHPKRPVILYTGQNDFESGLQPYTELSKKYHSPIFQSSKEALWYLSGLAAKNKWNLLYKPHPLMAECEDETDNTPENVIKIVSGNINDLIDFADMNITILSQTGYISLIRNKPTLMLGYTQLKNKGCCYEAFQISDIESEIKRALEEGFSEKMKKAFGKHIAQLLKYYLLDDLSERNIRYGRAIGGER